MTNHRIENGRRELLLTVAGGIAGVAVGSLPARVLAQPASGPPLSIRRFRVVALWGITALCVPRTDDPFTRRVC
jgi:hypothetical protein